MRPLKERLLAIIDAQARDQLDFLQALCHQNSFTYHKEGADRAGSMIREQMEGLMPVHKIFRQWDTGDHILFRNKPSRKAVYLVGHLDTVFPPDHPFQTCRRRGDRLHGPGTGDMKGGLAVIIYALKTLKKAGCLDRMSLAFLVNSDEEIGSVTSKAVFMEERKHASACLVGECAGPKGEIVTGRNGKLGARIECFGRAHHVGTGSHDKASAILELARKIVALEGLNASLPGVSLNVGKIDGGLSTCTVPDRAGCLLDVRWTQEEHRDHLVDKIRQTLASPSQPGCRSTCEILNERPAMPAGEKTKKILRLLRRAAADLGLDIAEEHRRGTSDANLFGAAGIPTLDGFGPVSEGDHTPDEFIMISSLKERTALLALFLAKYGVREK
jgi:glutamate carboxypeptidase